MPREPSWGDTADERSVKRLFDEFPNLMNSSELRNSKSKANNQRLSRLQLGDGVDLLVTQTALL